MIKEYKYNLKKNLILYSIYLLLSSFILTRGVFLIYLSSRGLTLLQVATYQAVYSISTSILEIPTGYFADRFGKKKSILLGTVLLIFHTFFMIINNKIMGFMLLGVLEALAYSFISGSDSALLFEMLNDMNSKEKYLKVNSFLLSASSIITGTALLFGTFIVKFSWNLLYTITTIVFAISAIFLIFVKENKNTNKVQIEKEANNTNTDQLIKGKSTFALEIFKRNILYPDLTLFIIFFVGSSLIDGFFMSYYNFNQLILKNYNIRVELIGMFFSALYFINSAAYLLANLLTKYFSKKVLFVYILFIEFALFISLSFIKTPVVVMLVSTAICFFPEILFTISDAIIQKYITSNYRATILSGVSLLRSLMSSIAYIILGYCFEVVSIHTTILYIGITIGLIGCFSFIMLKRKLQSYA